MTKTATLSNKKTLTFIIAASLITILAIMFLPVKAHADDSLMPEKFKNLTSTSPQELKDEFVKDAPKVDIAWYRTILAIAYTDKKVDQYKIEPGKYYIISTPGRGKLPYFSYKLVRVIRVYEDPTWYGSERTVNYINAETKKYGTACPNKGLKPPHFYNVDKYVVK